MPGQAENGQKQAISRTKKNRHKAGFSIEVLKDCRI
jgi:hypothetical protein